MDLLSRQRIAQWVIDHLQSPNEPSASEEARQYVNNHPDRHATETSVADLYADRLEYWADKFIRRDNEERFFANLNKERGTA